MKQPLDPNLSLSFLAKVSGGIEMPLISWLVDLAKVIMFWTGLYIVHVLVVFFVGRMLNPTYGHWIDLVEEGLLIVSIVSFLIESTFPAGHAAIKRIRDLI